MEQATSTTYPTKRCNVCETDISITNWSKHIKTKKHIKFTSTVQQRPVPETSSSPIQKVPAAPETRTEDEEVIPKQ